MDLLITKKIFRLVKNKFKRSMKISNIFMKIEWNFYQPRIPSLRRLKLNLRREKTWKFQAVFQNHQRLEALIQAILTWKLVKHNQ